MKITLSAPVCAATVLALAALAGCTTYKLWNPAGGNRGNGVVKLSYEYGPLESPRSDDRQGLTLAREQCGRWGYGDAEAFGGETRSCNEMAEGKCRTWMVTREYRCLPVAGP